MEAKEILIKYWGYTNFRLRQEEIINQILNNKDTLALLPTGGGKSICYQIPTLMSDGICLVISPLIALMEEQVRFLSSKGIKSITINSNMHHNEVENAITNCIYGNIKFLYLSPEKLQNNIIKQALNKLKINLITVDEAHCISEWGHNFRPAYRHIYTIREITPDTPILALTATATTNVIKDIQNNLKFKEASVIRSSFVRKNLSYVVDNHINKQYKLLKLVDKIKSSIIVYVGSRKEAENISKLLNNKNYSANYYHAGLDIVSRKKIQDRWYKNQERIIVATNAFGMGINKSDVRLVVHMQLPATIEQYFQEAGRAGRDEKQAYSFLLANEDDVKRQKILLKIKHPTIEELKNFYQNIANYLQIAENTFPNDSIPFNISTFSKRYNISTIQTFNMLKYLQTEEYLRIIHSMNDSKSKIMITIDNTDLYKFQISNKYYDNLIKLLLRLYPNIFNNLTPINELEISKKLKIDKPEIKRLLYKLNKLEIIKYQTNHTNLEIKFLKPRIDSKNLLIDQEKMEKRKFYDEKKLEHMSNFILSKDKCRSVMLLKYFGEIQEENCQKCDYCIIKKSNN